MEAKCFPISERLVDLGRPFCQFQLVFNAYYWAIFSIFFNQESPWIRLSAVKIILLVMQFLCALVEQVNLHFYAVLIFRTAWNNIQQIAYVTFCALINVVIFHWLFIEIQSRKNNKISFGYYYLILLCHILHLFIYLPLWLEYILIDIFNNII